MGTVVSLVTLGVLREFRATRITNADVRSELLGSKFTLYYSKLINMKSDRRFSTHKIETYDRSDYDPSRNLLGFLYNFIIRDRHLGAERGPGLAVTGVSISYIFRALNCQAILGIIHSSSPNICLGFDDCHYSVFKEMRLFLPDLIENR